jgi:hypothetical protein
LRKSRAQSLRTNGSFRTFEGDSRGLRNKKPAVSQDDWAFENEALFQSLDSGQIAASLAQRINDLENEHAKMVSDQIRRLKMAFGVARFEALDARVMAKISN